MEEQEAEEAREEHEEEEDDTDDERAAPILPIRIAHRLIGMLWGAGGGAVENPEELDSDDEIAQDHEDP